MIEQLGATAIGIGLAALAALWTWRGRTSRDRAAFLSHDWRAAQRRRE
jgi:hypothetical protein